MTLFKTLFGWPHFFALKTHNFWAVLSRFWFLRHEIIKIYVSHTHKVNICMHIVIRYTYVLWWKFRSSHEYFCKLFLAIPLLNQVQFVNLWKTIFRDSLTYIITNKWFFLPIFAAAPPITTPIANPIFEKLWPPSNTEPIINLSSPGLKGIKNGKISFSGCHKVWSALAVL